MDDGWQAAGRCAQYLPRGGSDRSEGAKEPISLEDDAGAGRLAEGMVEVRLFEVGELNARLLDHRGQLLRRDDDIDVAQEVRRAIGLPCRPHHAGDQGDGVTLDADRVSVPVAIVDIGGRTTDYVVVKDQGILHASSGSLQCGMLNVKQCVTDGIQEHFDMETLSEQLVSQALENNVVRLQGKDHDVAALVEAAKREVVERLHAETRRQLGLGVELDRILFVGGGTVALADDIANWFPHQAIAENPAFANARGMLKYLRYVCEASDAA